MKTNKNEHKDKNIIVKPKSYDELSEKYQIAIDLRLLGYTYQNISLFYSKDESTNNPKESLIRQWFSKNGICNFAFRQKKKERSKERKKLQKDLDNQFMQAAIECLPALRNKANRGNWQACELILRYAGLEPAKKNELTGKNGKELPNTVFIIPSNGRESN